MNECDWVISIDRNDEALGVGLLQPAFVVRCYDKAVATAHTKDGTRVGRVCRKHVKAARLEKFNIERLK